MLFLRQTSNMQLEENLFNFLDCKLQPKVESKSLAFDGYEVTNLISENLMVKSKGYLTYFSVKPPVNIDFELICPVAVKYISLDTVVGAQKSIGVEIFARSGSSRFVSVCRAFFFNENGVVFCDARSYSKKNRPPNTNEGHHLAFFKSDQYKVFANATAIRVTITRTWRSMPCLQNVEVWGNVSRNCSQVTKDTIRNMYYGKPPTSNAQKEEVIPENLQIPDDFKDTLTYEIMSIPMTLPSGNSIDKSTLEKCIANDVSHGRHGCDPFTGVKFTNTLKPQYNASLKGRIDMFLMENSHKLEISNVGRTVGSKGNSRTKDAEYTPYNTQSKRLKFDTSCGNDLDSIIQGVFSNENFVCFTKAKKNETDMRKKCCDCDKLENLYVLPCNHYYCKLCLLNISKILKCSKCFSTFLRSDPKRFHGESTLAI